MINLLPCLALVSTIACTSFLEPFCTESSCTPTSFHRSEMCYVNWWFQIFCFIYITYKGLSTTGFSPFDHLSDKYLQQHLQCCCQLLFMCSALRHLVCCNAVWVSVSTGGRWCCCYRHCCKLVPNVMDWFLYSVFLINSSTQNILQQWKQLGKVFLSASLL